MFAETGTSYAAATAAAQAALQLSQQQKPGVCSALRACFGASKANADKTMTALCPQRLSILIAAGSPQTLLQQVVVDHLLDPVAINQRSLPFQRMWCYKGLQLFLSGNIVLSLPRNPACLPQASGSVAKRLQLIDALTRCQEDNPHPAEGFLLSAAQNNHRMLLAKQACSCTLSVWQLPSAATLGLQHFFLLQNCLVWQMLSHVQLDMSDAVRMFA